MPNKETKQQLLTQTTLTIVACALACEAKPFIDFFKLKKITDIHAFSVYRAESIFLIVSGMGSDNMSAAINWLSGYLPANTPKFWLNVGVAGHQTALVGELFCAHSVSNGQHIFYPPKWLKHKLKLEKLLTVKQEETNYSENCLYDMEACAFYQSAIRFNSQETVQCLKIISDNKEQEVNRDKSFVSKLIHEQLDAIIQFIAQHTAALEQQNVFNDEFINFKQQIVNDFHFSHSQQLQLAKLCQAAQSHKIDLNFLDLHKQLQAKQILHCMKQHLDTFTVTL